MPFVFKSLILLLSIAVAWGADKDEPFRPMPASSYPAKQIQGKVTVAAQQFETDDQARAAFGKLNPYNYGILPVLVVIENGGAQTLVLDGIRAEYHRPDRRKIESTPAGEVAYLGGGKRPDVVVGGPMPSPIPRLPKRKNPLRSDLIPLRAFSVKMLPPGESGSGFFYFQTGHHKGATLYLTGIREARTGKDLFYFEVPLPAPSEPPPALRK